MLTFSPKGIKHWGLSASIVRYTRPNPSLYYSKFRIVQKYTRFRLSCSTHVAITMRLWERKALVLHVVGLLALVQRLLLLGARMTHLLEIRSDIIGVILTTSRPWNGLSETISPSKPQTWSIGTPQLVKPRSGPPSLRSGRCLLQRTVPSSQLPVSGSEVTLTASGPFLASP